MIELPSGAHAALTMELGEANVSTDMADLLANSRGVWPVEVKAMRRFLAGDERARLTLPGCVVRPADAWEVATVLRIAQEWRIPVVPFGGGSGITGGAAAIPGSISLDTKRLTSLRVDAVSMVAEAGGGISGIELETRLNAQGLSLGHFPQSLLSSTVGGWVATRASGTFSTRYGNIEDRVIGLEVALPGGELLRTRATPRSATGPDLTQWFIGSEGTLGVITEVGLSLHPMAPDQERRSFVFPSFEMGLQAIRGFMRMGARPGVARLYDAGETAHKFPGFGYDDGSALLLLVFEGESELVAADVAVTERACAAGFEGGREPVDHWWRSRFDTRGLVERNCALGGVADAIEVSAFWGDMMRVYTGMMDAAARHNVAAFAHLSHAYRSGGGLYVIVSGQAEDDEAAIGLYTSVVDDLLAACLENGGSISHHHGIGRGKARWLAVEHSDAGMALLKRIKQAFDPVGIMNPGVLGLGG
jgi:alkyldihydroxyacetonephosphate synthase